MGAATRNEGKGTERTSTRKREREKERTTLETTPLDVGAVPRKHFL